MTPLQQFALWMAGLGIPLLAMFCAWLVTQNTSRRVEIAELRTEIARQEAKFVTLEYMQKVEQWRADTQREFTEIRKEIQAVALAVARTEGTRGAHAGG